MLSHDLDRRIAFLHKGSVHVCLLCWLVASFFYAGLHFGGLRGCSSALRHDTNDDLKHHMHLHISRTIEIERAQAKELKVWCVWFRASVMSLPLARMTSVSDQSSSAFCQVCHDSVSHPASPRYATPDTYWSWCLPPVQQNVLKEPFDVTRNPCLYRNVKILDPSVLHESINACRLSMITSTEEAQTTFWSHKETWLHWPTTTR